MKSLFEKYFVVRDIFDVQNEKNYEIVIRKLQKKKQRSIIKLTMQRKQLKLRKKRSCTLNLNIIIVVIFSISTSTCSTLFVIKTNDVASYDQRVFAHVTYANF